MKLRTKKMPERLQALAMIMVLSLFICSMVESRLKRALERTGETMISQPKKQTKRPTLQWIFFLSSRAREYSVIGERERIFENLSLTGDLLKIPGLLGQPYEKYNF
jgi:transposase